MNNTPPSILSRIAIAIGSFFAIIGNGRLAADVTRVRAGEAFAADVAPQEVRVEVPVEKIVEVEVTAEPEKIDRKGAWLDTIVFVEEPNANAAVTRLEVGEIDLYAYQVSNREVVAKVNASANLDTYQSSGSYNELTFNPAGPELENGTLNPFAVPAVREAMNWLMDRNYIVQEIMGGMAIPRWLPFNTASADYARLADVARGLELKYAYNKEKAQEVAEEYK